ncbi:hypothetical protein PZN02_002368 [Sinorhizobium garamanticum]|uniref:Uncharacterized protein n=1 Tax=Sinorhizobium garamanticum TaxID=680247 RepID=A0ABY8D9B3_9HYPH|nr:hypothetical protein [Sinorhizobium garamanticum]WEX86110.1 hypothetical protein PZN02_002368 [Sinorhizobium garamanticum]
MEQELIHEGRITAQRLRPLVIVVVASKLAVLALLLTTVQFSSPPPAPEIAALR